MEPQNEPHEEIVEPVVFQDSILDKVKNHFQENQKFYVGVGTGALIVLIFHQRPIQVINTVAPVFHNNNSSTAFMGGYLHKIVRNDTTGEIVETVGVAAKRAGVSIATMSKHLNGHPGYKDIKGQIYSIIGIGN